MTVTSLLLLLCFRNTSPLASLHLVMTQNETDSRAPLSPADSLGEIFCPQHLLWGSDDEWETPKNRKGICVSGDEEGRVDREEREEAPQLTKMTRFYCRVPQLPNQAYTDLIVENNIQCIIFAGWEKTWCKIKYATVQSTLTCLASTNRVMKKMKRFTEPIVFRSFSTPGLRGERRDHADAVRELIYSGFTIQEDFSAA